MEIAQVGASTDMTKLKAMPFDTTHPPWGKKRETRLQT